MSESWRCMQRRRRLRTAQSPVSRRCPRNVRVFTCKRQTNQETSTLDPTQPPRGAERHVITHTARRAAVDAHGDRLGPVRPRRLPALVQPVYVRGARLQRLRQGAWLQPVCEAGLCEGVCHLLQRVHVRARRLLSVLQSGRRMRGSRTHGTIAASTPILAAAPQVELW